MNLRVALQVKSGEVVAFVGGGGKTTAMFRLAEEVVRHGWRVVTTTTTRIFVSQIGLAPVHVQTWPDLLAACERHPFVLWTGELSQGADKAPGVAVEDIVRLQSLMAGRQIPLANIIIEADGSRMRPFKAPAAHEPLIPECTTLVVPVVGIEVVGKPLTLANVHRPELVAAIAPGGVVTPAMVAAVVGSPLGGLKNVPAGARRVALINKVETEPQMAAALAIGQLLRQQGSFDRVVIGAVANGNKPLVHAW